MIYWAIFSLNQSDNLSCRKENVNVSKDYVHLLSKIITAEHGVVNTFLIEAFSCVPIGFLQLSAFLSTDKFLYILEILSGFVRAIPNGFKYLDSLI